MPGKRIRETVLYFTPQKKEYEMKLKGVLVRMGIRIRIVTQDQINETIGGLLGFSGWNADDKRAGAVSGQPDTKAAGEGAADSAFAGQVREITEEVLVMHNFTSRRMDELLMNLRKAGVPGIPLKAVVTETNCQWSFYHLYEEIREEHEKMTK